MTTQHSAEQLWDAHWASAVGNISSSAIRELLKVIEQPGVISFAGIKLVFDELVALAQAQFVSMASDALSIVQLAGVGEAIGITVGAITYRLTITTMSQIGILPS
mgnify:CR=1 FL=1